MLLPQKLRAMRLKQSLVQKEAVNKQVAQSLMAEQQIQKSPA